MPPAPLDASFLLAGSRAVRRSQQLLYTPLAPEELPALVRPGALCAIDAEFVARREEENEIRPDGSRALLRPSRLALARVSVVRGEVRGFLWTTGCGHVATKAPDWSGSPNATGPAGRGAVHR